MDRLWRVLHLFRNFLSKILNKQFLIFLFFLLLSSIFWLLMTLNETYEYDLTIDVRLAGVPRNVVIIEDPDSSVTFTVRDKGYVIALYMTGEKFRPIFFDFSSVSDGKGRGTILPADIQRQIYNQLYKGTKITQVKTDGVRFQYNLGLRKRVPVRLYGNVAPGKNYYMSAVKFTPDSVTVYASKKTLDSIQCVYTEAVKIGAFTDYKEAQVALRKTKGVKCIPAQVKAEFYADILTEETVQVPIQCVNLPSDKVVRTFPASVGVQFVVGANKLKQMPKTPDKKQFLPTGFKVIVDYNEIAQGVKDRCHPRLVASPNGVRDAHLVVDQVDYLIEQK